MFDQENSKVFNLMKVDDENWVVSHEDLMNPIIPNSFQGRNVEYIGIINIPNKYLEKQQSIEPNGEVFELR